MLLHEDNAPLSRSRDACQVKKEGGGPAQPPTVAGTFTWTLPRYARVSLGEAHHIRHAAYAALIGYTEAFSTLKPVHSRHIRVTLPVRDRCTLMAVEYTIAW